MKKLIVLPLLALAVSAGFSALAQTVDTVSNEVDTVQIGAAERAVGLSTMNASLVSNTPPEKPSGGEGQGEGEGQGGGEGQGEGEGGTPPDKPEGDEGGGTGGETPPDKPEGGEGGTGGGGNADTNVLIGAYMYIGGTNTQVGAELKSTTSDENVILAQSNAYVTVSNCTLNKSGDTSNEDNSNFFAVNAVVAAKTAAKIYIDNSTLNSNAEGANCLFASGEDSTIYAYNCTLTSTKGSSRGLDATYEGTVIASKMTIDTAGDHCAALATDRGNGYISATDSTLNTAGQGSPLIYSTGIIEVNGVTGTATGAQIAGIEGLSTIRIRNSNLSGSGEKASEPIANGVIIYQSMSGDSTEGTATFEVSDSTLSSAITNGAMFYITNSKADIRVQNAELDFDSDRNYLLKAAGNDGSNGWGTSGANGAEVVFTAINQKLSGNITVDGISSLDMYLTNSTYTGVFENDTTYTGNGDGIELFLSADSTWVVTSNCTLKSLTVTEGIVIRDGSERKVSIVGTNGTAYVTGDSGAYTVTVSSYTQGEVAITNAITDFEISRTAFETMYGISQGGEAGESGGGSSGGATDHDGWVYYCKPHPPDNAIVKVLVEGASDYGTPDRDHKYCLDGYWDGNAATGVVVHLLYVTTEGYLFADGCKSNTWDVTVTNNAQEIYPPEDVVAIRAQAKSGRTYYLTLKKAIESAKGGGKGGAKITLNDNVTLTETLEVTNSITLNLNTNVVTVGCALTPAFLFTADATISNGTIKSSLAADAEDSVLLRFTGDGATLSDVTLAGDCCLLYVDEATAVTVTNNCAFTCESAATVYCSSNGTLTIASDTSKSDGVVMTAPTGYIWENGNLVEGTMSESLAAGTASSPYNDAQSATNAAVVINANKADCIEVPSGVEGSAKATYLTKVEATVTSDNRVVIDLTPEAKVEEQAAIDEAVTNETVAAALTSTDASATATISKTTPGLYYWIDGATDLDATMNAGDEVLSKDGGAVELSKPKLDATKGSAFFRISAGLTAPVQSNGD